MVSAPQKCCAKFNSSPLQQADTLQKVLSYVGAGEHLFVAAVCSLWRTQYAEVEDMTVGEPVVFDVRTCTAQMTHYGAAFASASRVQLAVDAGLDLSSYECQYVADKTAGIDTLQSARGLGSNSLLPL
jgi:hypothetical protein